MTPEVLEPERPYLTGLAYRLLGSAADAEDMVQEAFVRAAGLDQVRSPRAMLTTIVTRLCLDELRSARRRRERYVGPWLPEPVLTGELAERAAGPDDALDAAESVSMALLRLLETLSPHERAVFVLREVLDLEFAEIAAAVERTEAACRQLLHRARAHVAAGRRRFPSNAEQRALAASFLAALSRGDVAAMIELMTDDADAITDHGGKAPAAQRTVHGAHRVARLLDGLVRKAIALGYTAAPAWVNGSPALVGASAQTIVSVVVLATAIVDGAPRITGLHIVRNPDKLGRALRTLGGP